MRHPSAIPPWLHSPPTAHAHCPPPTAHRPPSLCQAHHPDRHSAEERDASEAAFKEISQAYARLTGDGGDPTIRDELTKEVP